MVVIERVKVKIDEMITSKQQFMPKLLRENIHSAEPALLSNLHHLIDVDRIDREICQQKSIIHNYIFARYKYDRLTKGKENMIQTLSAEFNKVVGPNFLKIAEPLIHLLHQFGVKLGMSVFNAEGIQQELFFVNPPSVQKEQVPAELQKDFFLPYWILPPMRTADDTRRSNTFMPFVKEFLSSRYYLAYAGEKRPNLERIKNTELYTKQVNNLGVIDNVPHALYWPFENSD